jgi:uncharacterized membrane protein YeaQ/YmgE (transglycosylase-associated protein family)
VVRFAVRHIAPLYTENDMLTAIIVGLVAGVLAGRIMHGGYGILMDLVLGMAGGLVGGFVLRLIGVGAHGLIGSILVSTFGAVLLIWLARMLKTNRGTA